MFIKKDNLVIRSATLDDAEILTNWWNDGIIMSHAGFPNGLGQSLEETINQIKKNDIKLSQICIIEVESVRIGEMSFSIGQDFAQIGIKICNASYQNHGYGKCLLRMLIDYLFTDEKINSVVKIEKIILDTNINNKRAQNVYEKLGFRKVSTNVDGWKNQLGEWQTSIDYEMSLEDYRKACLI
ncbi:GNAT family N-acetyltransferase [Clostridium amazonitimonense]|uniref:GNAT family N-acetyltransferase n=1 Tax=Clostridium amazonitimonense TaxID=1499689 RepID=UPI0005099DF2|nr:GNAT family protein [Clostridium amazonitimonense]